MSVADTPEQVLCIYGQLLIFKIPYICLWYKYTSFKSNAILYVQWPDSRIQLSLFYY